MAQVETSVLPLAARLCRGLARARGRTATRSSDGDRGRRGRPLPEKRKVDSSILSLTTRSNQVILLFTCGNAISGHTWPPTARARPRPPKTGYSRPLVHVGGTAHQLGA